MTFSEAGERDPTPEVKEDKIKEIGETKTETREVDEKVNLVANAHTKPDEMIERVGDFEQAEAIESAVVMSVEAPVAFVDQAVKAAADKQEQSGGDVAIDTVPLPEKPEIAGDGGKVAIDTVPMPEDVSQSRAEDGGEVAIDTVPIPEEVSQSRAEAGGDVKSDQRSLVAGWEAVGLGELGSYRAHLGSGERGGVGRVGRAYGYSVQRGLVAGWEAVGFGE